APVNFTDSWKDSTVRIHLMGYTFHCLQHAAAGQAAGAAGAGWGPAGAGRSLSTEAAGSRRKHS
ncbi:unnamed protein product, partial [Bubo scandiacus]